MTLSARQVLIWLVLLAALIADSALSLAHLVLGGSALVVASLWTVRVLALAACWLLPGSRTAKAWGSGLILGFLVLDALAKAPVLGTIEYGDWFLARSLDLTGQYGGYLVTGGFIVPLLLLAGWFILRARHLPGWIAGLLAGAAGSLALLLAGNSPDSTTVTYLLLDVARFVIPAWVAALADAIVRRRSSRPDPGPGGPGAPHPSPRGGAKGPAGRKLSTKSRRHG